MMHVPHTAPLSGRGLSYKHVRGGGIVLWIIVDTLGLIYKEIRSWSRVFNINLLENTYFIVSWTTPCHLKYQNRIIIQIEYQNYDKDIA